MRRWLVTLLIRLAGAVDYDPDLYLVANYRRQPNSPNTPRPGVVEPFICSEDCVPIAVPGEFFDDTTLGREWGANRLRVPKGMKVAFLLGDPKTPVRIQTVAA